NQELLLDVRAAEVRLKVRLSRLEACEVILSEIVAQVSADLRLCPEGFKGSLRLVERPKLRSEVVLVGKPSSTGAAAAATGSYAWIAEEVTTAVSQAVTEIFLTDSERNSGSGSPHLQPPSRSSAVSGCFEFGPGGQSASAAVGIKETVSRRENRPNTVSREPQKQPQAVNGSGPNSTSLLIKLIKATGLKPGINAMPLNPFACVELDEPYQRHVTGSVYGSANPYWDQSYMLDLTPQSKRLSLHVFDRTNQSDLLLGSASILLDDLPSQGARVIQPLRMPRRDTAASSSVQPPTLTAEFLFVSAAAPSTMAGNSSGSNSNRFAGPRAASVSSVSAESAVTVVHVSPNSAHRSSGVGSSPESDESMVVLTSLEAAKSRTTPAAASADQLEQQQQQSGKKQKTDGTNSSLSRTVDEFMKSTDVSYQPMSSTDSAASQQQQQPSFSGVADSPPKKPPPIPLHHGQLVSESFPPDSRRRRWSRYNKIERQESVPIWQFCQSVPSSVPWSRPEVNWKTTATTAAAA
uniref:C2 domain-containing protein n=2 Tax=Macrostomum lignano TaxID=282301 RepID=A0A1I8GDP0_9PLAT